MNKIYVTSDLHFGHDREFIWKVRGYDSVDSMNMDLVSKWNNTVTDEDDVYVLGDLMLGLPLNIKYIELLRGKLHIVLGNHDTKKREEMYKELNNVVEIACAIRLDYKKYHFFMTHYPCLTGNLEKEYLRQMTLNLYGHTHQKTNFYEDRPYMYHCGVDSHDGYPVDLDQVIEDMKAKVNECKQYLDENPVEIIGYINDSNIPTLMSTARCSKCVYSWPMCGSNDSLGGCNLYKRDPPDGGYYS